ncbi:MAG TPA: efflux RND transporter periplasmic adaptor subunit [Puia sp.]|jgi:membrane fusion protein (multidrug efflux system)|nr:efflux RND transporter periplasmic adaptor subunit [Puia sp.]
MSSVLFRGFCVGVLIISFISCKDDENKKPSVSPDVNVVAAGKENLPVYSEYVGQTYGLSDINIEPRIEGWITGIHFKEGSLVQKGSLLYTIDDVPTLNRIDASKAELARVQVLMENKKTELARVKPLADMNALSQRDLDYANAAYEASVNEVKIAEARLANASIELSYTRMTAPITGIIGISKVQVGDYVSRVSLQNGINAISSLGEVRVRFPVAENDYLKFVRQYKKDPSVVNFAEIPVELILGDGSVFGEKGRLQLTNRQIDPATGSILVQAIFKNASGLLRPGQYVKVRFLTGEYNNAIVIPQQAVNQLQNIYQVFLLTDSNKIKPAIIKVGSRVGSNWIVNEGLKEGEKVAILGSAFINTKMEVKPVLMNWNYDSTSKN